MKVRYIKKPHITGHASQFNLHSASEVLVQFDEGDATSEYQRELEVYFPHLDKWVPMVEAFAKGDLITDDYNTQFFASASTETRRAYWVETLAVEVELARRG